MFTGLLTFTQMRALFFLLLFLPGFLIYGQGCDPDFNVGNPDVCCFDCTCTTCADIGCCNNPTQPAGECSLGGANNCGKNPGDPKPCDTFYENNTAGVQSTTPQPIDPNGCIPIDGGLGFLMAGGLGMGVLGIRRRKSGVTLGTERIL